MMTTTHSNYKSYFKSIRDAQPQSQTSGQVKGTVDYFKNDAFAKKPVPKSEDTSHSHGQCVRVFQSLCFWRHREENAR